MAFASDYVDVAHRIAAFFDRYPDGSIQAEPPSLIEVGGKVYVTCTARVYRSPEDERPAQASAWEPWPGTTNFTRDSEAMNCETSAVGRAIAFLGFEVKKGIATRQDVERRQQPRKKAAAKKAAVQRSGFEEDAPPIEGDPIGDDVPIASAKASLLATCGGDTEMAKRLWGTMPDGPTVPAAALGALLAKAEQEMCAPFTEGD